MERTGGCNSHGNGFSSGMRTGAGGQFPSSSQLMGPGTNPCPPSVPNASVGVGGDMCCGNGQSQAGPNTPHMSSGMNSQMAGYQGGTMSNGLPGIRGGNQGNNFMANGGFQNEFGSHGQVCVNCINQASNYEHRLFVLMKPH